MTTMKTAEMWNAAQKNGKTYKCNGMRYSLVKGFYDPSNGHTWPTISFSTYSDSDGRHGFDAFMNCDWEENSLNIKDLKVGKIYIAFIPNKMFYEIGSVGNLYTKSSRTDLWDMCQLSYNEVKSLEFYEV